MTAGDTNSLGDDDSFESASTISTPPPPPIAGKSCTLPFLIVFLIRLLILIGIFAMWAINIILQFKVFKTGRIGFVPADGSVWSNLHLRYNSESLFADLFYPSLHLSKTIKSEQNLLRLPVALSKVDLRPYFKLIVAFCYAIELVILSPLALVGFFIAYKNLKCSRKCCRIWICLLVICLVGYIVGLVNFCMMVQFITVYWIDIVLILVMIILLAIRIRWMSSMINNGYLKIPKTNAVDPEANKDKDKDKDKEKDKEKDPDKIINHTHNHMPEQEIKKDPDYQILFVDFGRPPADSAPPTPTTSSSALPSTVPSTDMSPSPSQPYYPPPPPPPAPENHTSESHVVEKHTTTTIIQAAPQPQPRAKKASKKKDKKSKKKKKKKSKKKKKKK